MPISVVVAYQDVAEIQHNCVEDARLRTPRPSSVDPLAALDTVAIMNRGCQRDECFQTTILVNSLYEVSNWG